MSVRRIFMGAHAAVVATVLAAAARHPLGAQGRAVACLRYEPDTVVLTGILRRHTYPGPPNFESVRAGDAPETGYYLHLGHPVCASRQYASDAEEDAAAARHVDARLVQLVLDSAGYARLRPLLGQRVTLRGRVFSAFTGHHHAPLVMTVLPPAERR